MTDLGRRLADAIERDSGCTDARLLAAFAATPRERFLRPPPWLIARRALDGSATPAYVETSELADVYDNVSVALDASRQLFNGAPGTVAVWLEALAPREGERAFHAGCGSGYYSAVLARLVDSVVAVDVDEALIKQAGEALADFPNVSVLAADATAFAPSSYDVGMANMGVSVIPEPWLERMNPHGGRMAFPLTVPIDANLSKGIVLLVERAAEDVYTVRMIGVAVVFAAAGKADQAAQRKLMTSLMSANPHEVKSLRRDPHPEDATCWLHEERYCLSSVERRRPGG